jgi:hypothetical protein
MSVAKLPELRPRPPGEPGVEVFGGAVGPELEREGAVEAAVRPLHLGEQ